MDNVSSVASAAASATTGNTGQSRTTLVENYDTFLQLLVAQVKAQDPTSPMDTNQFTQQLVQFSELEQGIQTNENIENLVKSISSANAAGLVSYIGGEVTADGATTVVNGGKARWSINATDDAQRSIVQIKDVRGNIVHTREVNLSQGENAFEWDGTKDKGAGSASDGERYSIEVTAKDFEDNRVDVSTTLRGVVDGIDFSKSEPFLQVGGISVPQTAIKSVSTPS